MAFNNQNNNTNGKQYQCGVTPELITKLQPNEIFVFGSNLQGRHGGGAARIALTYFGAILGQGVGLQGQSYAIPTMQGPAYTIQPYVDDFIKFAKENPHMHFLVTKIGCGIAGFTPEEIAPLFRDAIGLSNVSLPQEFIDFILSNPLVPTHVIKKLHGQTRTLVDIVCEMNKERRFQSPREIVDAVYKFLDSKKNGPDSIAWNFSTRALASFAPKCMTKNGLNIERLYGMMEELFSQQITAIDKIYKEYVIEKTLKMVEMLNEFRRYTEPDMLLDDLWKAGVFANHCGAQVRDYYFDFASPGGMWNYILRFLMVYTVQNWNEIAPSGTLDNELYKEFMYRRHARGVEKYGLEAVLRRNYHAEGPCHAEVYTPYRGGAGPVYIEQMEVGENLYETIHRRIVKSCGEGKGPNYFPDLFEFERIRPLILEDPKYVYNKVDDDYYTRNLLVPKDDVTLPVYHYDRGKVIFCSEKDKEMTIRTIWKRHPELFGK